MFSQNFVELYRAPLSYFYSFIIWTIDFTTKASTSILGFSELLTICQQWFDGTAQNN